MQDYQEAMVKSLIAVAWADGKVEDEETEVIDAENLEILLRLARKAARPELSARPASDLFRLISRLQCLDGCGAATPALPTLLIAPARSTSSPAAAQPGANKPS